MARFSFASFNKKRFDVDTTDFDYKDLEDLYNADGDGAVYLIKGIYIGTKSKFDPETPIIATDECFVNIPVHQLQDIKDMLACDDIVEEVNNEHCGFTIQPYIHPEYQVQCYQAVWVDYTEAISNK
ncbi:MAG: hypothetical protein J6S67_13445 [Methanobrevibacter sp.]|nr:hypothetical protein [Methanobrevibacter sp.]